MKSKIFEMWIARKSRELDVGQNGSSTYRKKTCQNDASQTKIAHLRGV